MLVVITCLVEFCYLACKVTNTTTINLLTALTKIKTDENRDTAIFKGFATYTHDENFRAQGSGPIGTFS
jgi:hypothetical protein